MLLKTFLILLFAYPLLLSSEARSQSNGSDLDTTGTDSNFYNSQEQANLRKEVELYIADRSSEYSTQLSEAIVLFQNQQYDEADRLLLKTRNNYPDQPDLLALHAETIALLNNGSFTGEPFDLLSRALDLDNTHKPSLWMMALLNQQSGNHEAAVILTKLLKLQMPADSDALESIDLAMKVSLDHTGIPENTESLSENTKPEDDSITDIAADSTTEQLLDKGIENPSINLYITLEPEILDIFSPDDTVYVFAQAPDGSPTPLAVTRRQISDFPSIVTLDNSMSMVPELQLSSSKLVTVGARASRSGTAMPLPGDWEVKLYEVPIETTDTIPLNIHFELK